MLQTSGELPHWYDQLSSPGHYPRGSDEVHVSRCPVSDKLSRSISQYSIPSYRHSARYRFHQNTDLFYLTGLQEPDCVLLLETTPTSPLPHHTSTLYVRPRDPHRYHVYIYIHVFTHLHTIVHMYVIECFNVFLESSGMGLVQAQRGL